MKKYILNYASKLIITSILLIITTHLFGQATNFTGTWKLNVEKTKAPGINVNSFLQIIKVNQDNNSITINRIPNEEQNEKFGYIEVLKFDGSTTDTTTPSKLKRSSTLKWSADLKSFTETFTSKDDQGNIKQKNTQTWTLSADGRTLTVTADLQVEERSFQMEQVYDKE